ncbi:MAG: hypothetical protein HWE26_17050 [Alteromonadaceae bacterium]|nr:hypothetical protein [Alteromonadaceae bacterium]
MMVRERLRPGQARPVGSEPQQVTILQLLEWAFQRELVSLDFDPIERMVPDFGMEYVMIERARLGCRVDGGGRSDPHPDADAVADALVALPVARGGRRMALTIAELARAGQVPDWGQGAEPRCRPVGWRQTRHGKFAKTESAGSATYISRGRTRTFDMRYCPVTIYNGAREIAAKRRAYLLWWSALMELRDTFRIYGGLSAHLVLAAMPPKAPWRDV